jgi:hypothetical protein
MGGGWVYTSPAVEQIGTSEDCSGGTPFLSGAALSSAEAFFENPGCTAFTAIHFTGVTVNGSPLGALAPVKVTGPSAITVSPVVGSSFRVT